MLRFIAAVFSILILHSPLSADDVPASSEPVACVDNAIVTINAKVGEVFLNKAGTWSIQIFQGSGTCYKELANIVITSPTKPPPECHRGNSVTATIQVKVDDLFGMTMVNQSKLISLTCQ